MTITRIGIVPGDDGLPVISKVVVRDGATPCASPSAGG
jgi:hypothetical protein